LQIQKKETTTLGLFDKVKGALGGHGTTVTFTRLERQDPASACFPVTDSVFKGNISVTTDKDAVVLKHVYRAILKVSRHDGGFDERILDSDKHDSSTTIHGADISWPYTLAAGETKTDGFILTGVDLPSELVNFGIHDPNQAVDNPAVQLVIEAIADVKGSPFDPKAEAQVRLTGTGASAPAVSAPSSPARPLVFYEDGYFEAAIIESAAQGHHIQWDDGTDSWVAPDAVLANGTVIPTAAQLASGQQVVARYEGGFYQCTVASVDPGDMVNPAKVLISWDDGTESWVSIADVRTL